MKQSDLAILVQQGEGATLEFKERLSQSAAREFVAFANTIGGRVLFGVADDGKVIGVRDSNALRARIQDLARNCDPPVDILVEPLGPVVVAQVRESRNKPVQCAEGFFTRQGAVTQKLSRQEIRDFFQKEGVIRFDLMPCPRFDYPDDFDREKFDAWLRLSGITGESPVEEVLVNIEAAERDGSRLLFRNAGVLCFARKPRRFFSGAYITCLLGRGTDKVGILDRRDFEGGVVDDIEQAMRFVERNTRTTYRIEGLRRQEIREYPMAAVREAITNAVIHRDWFFEGANVFVEIYSNRIEVTSPGGLPAGMTEAQLGRRSVRRNPLLSDLLHRIGFIEKAGTGILRIREEARRQGCPEPTITAEDFVTVVFHPSPESRPEPGQDSSGQGATPPVTPSDQDATPPVTPSDQGPPPPVTPSDQAATPPVTPSDQAATPPVTPSDQGATPPVMPSDQGGGPTGVEDSMPRETPIARLLRALSVEMRPVELRRTLRLTDRRSFRETYLTPALEAGLIEMTIPEKPRSSQQRYRRTAAGRRFLERLEETTK